MRFPVKLDNFEGPLDLLLHLIKKNEVNIHDIPIALITQQYLDAIELMQELNLDVAGDFLVMAATLIHIKSKMLLPRPETAAGVEGDEEDPRDALVRRLLEHQKFKAAAGLLHEREQVRSAQWQRPDERVAEIAGDDYEPELEVDLFSLLTAFQAVVQRAKQRPKVLLPPEQMSVEARIEQLLARLSETEACGFEELFADVTIAAGWIVTFLALLEMIRLKLVRVFQSGSFGPIRVYKRARRPTRRIRLATRRDIVADERGGRRQQDGRTGRKARSRRKDQAGGTGASSRSRERRAEGDSRSADLRVAGAADAEGDLQAARHRSRKEDVQAALAELKQDYERPGGLQLVEVAGGYQIVTRPDLHEWVRRLFHERTTQKLTVQALETLAVIAYRQPITGARNHRSPRRQHVRRAQHAARAAPDQDRRPQSRWSAGRSSTRRRRSS